MKKIITLAIAMLVLAGASLASAAEVTRDEYKSQVEPICETNTKSTEKLLKNVKSQIKSGKLKPAGVSVAKAASSLKAALPKLKAVPQPTADTAKLTKWLSYLEEEVDLTNDVATALKANNKNKANSAIAKVSHVARLANQQVLSFGFKYCKQNEAQFAG